MKENTFFFSSEEILKGQLNWWPTNQVICSKYAWENKINWWLTNQSYLFQVCLRKQLMTVPSKL